MFIAFWSGIDATVESFIRRLTFVKSVSMSDAVESWSDACGTCFSGVMMPAMLSAEASWSPTKGLTIQLRSNADRERPMGWQVVTSRVRYPLDHSEAKWRKERGVTTPRTACCDNFRLSSFLDAGSTTTRKGDLVRCMTWAAFWMVMREEM